MHREAPATGRSIQSAQTPEAADPRRPAIRPLAFCAALWLLAVLLAVGAPVQADDYVIDDEQTTTNGGHTLDGDDTLTITAGGSVVFVGQAVYARGTGNTIINNGTISAGGFYGDGIRLHGSNNVAINNGTITTTGEQGDPMQSGGGGNFLYNHGTIRASGLWTAGIYLARAPSYAENTGLIVATGLHAHGMTGQQGGQPSTFVNSGTIIATGGEHSHAIATNGLSGTVVVNSGTLMSADGNSICFVGDGNTITLKSGSFLEGHLFLGTGTTVNVLMPGPMHSIRWRYEAVYEDDSTVVTPLQYFHDQEGGVLAFYDHTALAGTLDQLGDTQSLLAALGAHGARQKGPHLWATATGAGFTHDGDQTTFERDVELGAFAAGYNHKLTDSVTVGVMMAYLWGEQDGNSWLRPTYTMESRGFFGGARASIDLGLLDVELGATVGRIDYEHERFINDVDAPLGESWASSEYDGIYYSVDATMSARIPVATVTLKPTLGVIYTVHDIDGHTESGAADNATIDDRELSLLTVKAGVAVEKKAVRRRDGACQGRVSGAHQPGRPVRPGDAHGSDEELRLRRDRQARHLLRRRRSPSIWEGMPL